MADDPVSRARFSLRRWSRRKVEAAGERSRSQRAPNPAAEVAPAPADASGAAVATVAADQPPAAAHETPQALAPDRLAGSPVAEPALPPPESLTFDSDFTPFMRPGVDANVRQSAVRKLLRDPRFNVMDGLDVYIDDYSIESPIEPELVRTLMQARYIFNPPQTRVNEQGFVEDIPSSPAPGGDTATNAAQENESADAAAMPVENIDVAPPIEPAEAIPVGRADVAQSIEPADAALPGAAQSAGTDKPVSIAR